MRKFIALIITGLALALAASAMSSSTDGIKRVGTSVKFMANYYTSGGNRWVVTGRVSNGSLSPSGRRVYVFRDGTNYLGIHLHRFPWQLDGDQVGPGRTGHATGSR
jgi:hypothetical protein